MDATGEPETPEIPESPAFSVDTGEEAQGGPGRWLGHGLGAVLHRVTRLAQGWDDSVRSSSFLPTTEKVMIDARRHPFLLVAPGLRTLVGALVVVAHLSLALVLLFAASTLTWAELRLRPGLRRAAIVAAVTAVGLIVVDGVYGPVPAVLLLLVWLAEDVADWYSDRLVVTDKRLYRRHGVIIRHAPSISLTAIAYIDASVPPVGLLLGYGTLRLDSVAQRDDPLSRFDLMPDVVPLSHEILRLRAAILPRSPQ